MERPPFEFDMDKAIEAILYIVEKGPRSNFHSISKVMYFADKEHLEEYGRFICGDRYVAMRHGPVPSNIYDILKVARGDRPFFSPPREIMELVGRAFAVHGNHEVTALRRANTDLLSDSDLECLDHAIENYGGLPFDRLTELSHDEVWEATDENDFIEIGDILETFEDGRALREHLRNPHPGEAI